MMEQTSATQSAQKPSRRFWMLLLTIALFGVLYYLSDNFAFLNAGTRVAMLDTEYWFLFSAVLLLEGIYLFSAIRFYQVKIKVLFLALSLLLFLGGTIAAITNPGLIIEGGGSYLPTFSDRARSIGTTLAMAFGLYLLFAVMPEVLRGRLLFTGFSGIFVVVVFLAILYSLDKDRDIYTFLLQNGYFKDAYWVPQSWTTNRNVYAMMIFMGMICECYLHEQHPHAWRWAVILFFAFSELFILSKTVLFVMVFFLPTYYLYRVIRVYKKHKVRDILTLLSVIAIAIAIAIMYFNGTINAYLYNAARFFGSLSTMINSTATNSMQARLHSWTTGYNALSANQMWLFFGWGSELWQGCLNGVFNVRFEPSDSSYITTLFQYGLLGLGIYLCLLGYVLAQIILAIKHRHKSGFFFLIYWCCYLAFSVTESHVLVNFTGQGSMIFLTLVLPVLALNSNDRNKELINYEIDKKTTKPTRFGRLGIYPVDIYQNALITITPILTLTGSLLLAFSKAFSFFTYQPSVLAISALSVFYLLLPFYFSSLFSFLRLGRKGVAFWSGFLYVGVFAALLTGFFYDQAGFYAFFGLAALSIPEIALLGGYPPLKEAFRRSVSLWLAYFLSLALSIFTVAFASPFTPQMLYSLLAFDILLFVAALLCRRHIDFADWYYLSRWNEIEKTYSRFDRWIAQHDLTAFV